MATERLDAEQPVELIAYTDGACSGNPGPGGWGVLLQHAKAGSVIKEREFSGGESATTNNRMEMVAAIKALESLSEPTRIQLYTDSQYLKNGITVWIRNWRANGWRTAKKKQVKNSELWQRFGRTLRKARCRVELAQRPCWHRRKRKSGRARAKRDEALP